MFRFVLDDLGAMTLEELAARSLHTLGRLVQLAFWSARAMDRLSRAAPWMRAIAERLERDGRTRAMLTQLYVYLWRVTPQDVAAEDIRSILLEVAGSEGVEDVVNAAEQLEHKGEVRALRAAVARVLSARSIALSQVGSARLAACTDVDELSRWHDRAVTAGSEAEVFASDSAP
jgi:hypothetical protein